MKGSLKDIALLIGVALACTPADARAHDLVDMEITTRCPLRSPIVVFPQHAHPPRLNLTAVPVAARPFLQAEARLHDALREAHGAPRTPEALQRAQALYAALTENDAHLRDVLERNRASLTQEAWLLLSELRFGAAMEAFAHTEHELPDVRHALVAARQAEALGGLTDTGMWARYFEAELYTRQDATDEAIVVLGIVVANSSGPIRVNALLDLAWAYRDKGDLSSMNVYIDRVLPLLASDGRRNEALLLSVSENADANPTRAFEHGLSYLREATDLELVDNATFDVMHELMEAGGTAHRARVTSELPHATAERVMHPEPTRTTRSP